MHNDTDLSAETSDGRWLTYDQLAALRRIDKPSAVKLATRNRWRRRKSNAGQMQVFVPITWFERAKDRRDKYAEKSADSADIYADKSTDNAAFETALTAIEAAHASEVAALRGQLDMSEQARIGAHALADRSMAQLADAGARADRFERDLAAALSVADQARADARKAQEVAEALRRADDARRRGVVGRVSGPLGGGSDEPTLRPIGAGQQMLVSNIRSLHIPVL